MLQNIKKIEKKKYVAQKWIKDLIDEKKKGKEKKNNRKKITKRNKKKKLRKKQKKKKLRQETKAKVKVKMIKIFYA